MPPPKDPEKYALWLQRLSAAASGKKLSEETRRKLMAASTGKKASEATKRKMSENLKQRWAGGEYRAEQLERLNNEEATAKRLTKIAEYWQNPENVARNSERSRSRQNSKGKNFGNKWNVGRKASADTRAKMSESHKGKFVSEEIGAKISKAKLGKPRNGNGYKHSEETRAKMSKAKLGKSTKGHKPTVETLRKKSQTMLLLWQDPMYRENVLTTTASPEYRAKRSNKSKEIWQDPEYQHKVLSRNGIRPNKFEKRVHSILAELFPGDWRYVGDGSVVIGGRNPDFICDVKHLLLEAFGDYWHKDDDPQERINHFKKFGYDTLVIWESELKDVGAVYIRLVDFVGGTIALPSPGENGHEDV